MYIIIHNCIIIISNEIYAFQKLDVVTLRTLKYFYFLFLLLIMRKEEEFFKFSIDEDIFTYKYVY